MYPSVSIIVLNWNGKVVTRKCIDSILNSTVYHRDKLNLIIVDNGSTDGSVFYLREAYKNVKINIDFIPLSYNCGFIKANNIAIKYAICKYNVDYIFLLNNDTEVIDENWLKDLIEIAESDECIGIVGPKLIFPDGKIQWSGAKRDNNILSLIIQTITARRNPGFGKPEKIAKEANFVGDVNTISGASFLIKRKLIDKIGMLDLSLEPMFQEDVEYCFRAWKFGYRVVYVGNVRLMHYEGYSVENTGNENDLIYLKHYWALRNSIIVSLRYFGVLKTFLFGFPIFLFATFFDKKNKTEKLTWNNLKLRFSIQKSTILFFTAVKDALMRFQNENTQCFKNSSRQ